MTNNDYHLIYMHVEHLLRIPKYSRQQRLVCGLWTQRQTISPHWLPLMPLRCGHILIFRGQFVLVWSGARWWNWRQAMTDHLYYTPRNQCDLQWLRNTCDKFHMYVLNLKSTEKYMSILRPVLDWYFANFYNIKLIFRLILYSCYIIKYNISLKYNKLCVVYFACTSKQR